MPTTREIGLSSKDIHEARIVRDAEAANPGIIKATLDALVEAGDAGLMNVGARGNPNGQGASLVRVADEPAQITLAEAGIDKNLADRARRQKVAA